MLIVGTKCFVKEVLEIFYQLDQLESFAFCDDIYEEVGDLLFDIFLILKNENEVNDFFIKN